MTKTAKDYEIEKDFITFENGDSLYLPEITEEKFSILLKDVEFSEALDKAFLDGFKYGLGFYHGGYDGRKQEKFQDRIKLEYGIAVF